MNNYGTMLPAISQSSASVALARASSSSGSRVTLSMIGSTLCFGTKTFPINTRMENYTTTFLFLHSPTDKDHLLCSHLSQFKVRKMRNIPQNTTCGHADGQMMMNAFLSSLTALLCRRV